MSYDVDSLIKKFTLYGNTTTNPLASPAKSHQYDNEFTSTRYNQEPGAKRPSDFVTRLNDSSLVIRNILPQQAPACSFDQSNFGAPKQRKPSSNSYQNFNGGSNTQLNYKANSFQMNQQNNKTCSTSTSRNELNNEMRNYHYNPIYNTFQEHMDLKEHDLVTTAAPALASTRSMNNLSENEKSKFFNTLKSLFAIFDPECKGSIDLNELEKLGSNKNEILNEVVEYLRKRNECYSPRSNRNFSGVAEMMNSRPAEHSSYRHDSSSSSARVNDSDRPKFFIAQQQQQSPQQYLHGSQRSIAQSDFATPNSFVTFDEFVKAAELILDKRKQIKAQNQKNVKSKSNEQICEDLSETTNSNNEDISYYSNSASSSSSSPSSSSSSNRKSNTQSSQSHHIINQPTSNDDLSDADRESEPSRKLADKTNFMAKSPTKSVSAAAFNCYPSYQSPSLNKKPAVSSTIHQKVTNNLKMNSMTTSSLSSASSNLLASTSASATSSSSSIDMTTTTHTKTLSQAFDESAVFSNEFIDHRPASKSRRPLVSLSGVATISPSKGESNRTAKPETETSNRVIKVSTNFNLNNANSCDLNGLIDKENYLLKEGLNEIESVRAYYLSQLKENQQKQNNIARLKHQNLFGIDKMLLDLKQLNDFNLTLKDFMMKNAKPDMGLESDFQVLAPPAKPAKSESTKTVHFSLAQNQPAQQLPPPPPPPPQQPMPQAASMPNVLPAGKNSNEALPKYKEYIEQLDLYKNDADLDKYLKEKQERIDALQKEKSMLIRKLFEMKSASASLKEKGTQHHQTSLDASSETVTGPSASGDTPTSSLFNTTICQLIETPKANNQRTYENLSYRSPTTSQNPSTNEMITASYRTPTANLTQYNQQHHKAVYQSAQLPKQPHQKQLKFNNCDQSSSINSQSNNSRMFMNQKFI